MRQCVQSVSTVSIVIVVVVLVATQSFLRWLENHYLRDYAYSDDCLRKQWCALHHSHLLSQFLKRAHDSIGWGQVKVHSE